MKNNTQNEKNTKSQNIVEDKKDSKQQIVKNSLNNGFVAKLINLPLSHKIVIGCIVILLIIILYSLFFSSKEKPKAPVVDTAVLQAEVITLPAQPAPQSTSTTLAQLEPPKVSVPLPPVTVPVHDESLHQNDVSPSEEAQYHDENELRTPPIVHNTSSTMNKAIKGTKDVSKLLGENIIVFGGGAKVQEKSSNDKQFLGFDGGAIDRVKMKPSDSPKTMAMKLSDLDRTLLQGKIIEGVLESAISTALSDPGIIRAVISRDVYSENGRNVLIPKGSRVVGTYAAQGAAGQVTVAVVWNRLITPSGVDIKIDAKSSDKLGRLGVQGYMDDHWAGQLASAFLLSFIVPIMTYKMTDQSNSEVVSNSGGNNNGVTTTTTALSQALSEASGAFQNVANNVVNNRFPQQIIMKVDQGAAINIFVSKDMYFGDE
ncbi:TraB/TrbI/VirB10 family type IV secretion system protein [Candidatus Fokinia crypta]|uniref:Type IV secretion system protein VirB10 n=1 Tax=Candidatus Fokinia crypta TaxID=1920990 RepID=A0ABZ0UUM2_9RICK|nr:TrbI/VirB10 family protein [Candidatus Fokinia cryptica]WPX97775.1 Type IV secretion system protein VirB10 [Candidatus Fokinia cryptica]